MITPEWVDLLFGVLLGKKSYLKTGLVSIAENKPVSLPKGCLNLIAEIFFASENKSKTSYIFEQITAHIFKIISLQENFHLKRYHLKDIR